MEEDIKILEEFIGEGSKDWKCIDCGFNCTGEIQAIENLIKGYKEVEKERDGIYADYQDLGKAYYESIPKSKVKEIIEELEEIEEIGRLKNKIIELENYNHIPNII